MGDVTPVPTMRKALSSSRGAAMMPGGADARQRPSSRQALSPNAVLEFGFAPFAKPLGMVRVGGELPMTVAQDRPAALEAGVQLRVNSVELIEILAIRLFRH